LSAVGERQRERETAATYMIPTIFGQGVIAPSLLENHVDYFGQAMGHAIEIGISVTPLAVRETHTFTFTSRTCCEKTLQRAPVGLSLLPSSIPVVSRQS
jgi:hypothetical protein